MHPRTERSALLRVGESAAGLHVVVPRHPLDADAEFLHPEPCHRAIGHRTGAFEDLHVLPRGQQAIDGARAKMPVRKFVGGRGHAA